jgi:hypothetical protein
MKKKTKLVLGCPPNDKGPFAEVPKILPLPVYTRPDKII